MKTILKNCKETHHLIFAQEDRPLSLLEKLNKRVHLLTCKDCTQFEKNTLALRGGFKQWRNYQETESKR